MFKNTIKPITDTVIIVKAIKHEQQAFLRKFPIHKRQTDRYDKLISANKQISTEQDEFVELLCKCFDNANDQKLA